MKVAIIGGGFTGLTAAYELSKLGHRVSVFEKDEKLGGLAVGWKSDAWIWSLERGYHHLFTGDETIINLITELGLGDKLIVKRPVTATLFRGRMYQLDSATSLLNFPGMSFFDRLKTGAMILIFKLWPWWQPLEWITATKLVKALGGEAGWKTIWEPLMKGKFGPYAEGVAASWFWARIKKRTPSLAYPGGGFQTIIEALAKAIKKNGGKIYTNIKLVKLDQLVMFDQFDQVLLTIPTPLITKLVPQLADELKDALTIPHLHAQVLILETDKPILKDIYWLNVTDTSCPFLAVVAHTNFMDKKYYGGKHITYIGNYLLPDHPYLKLTKEQLCTKFLPFIKKLNPPINYELRTMNLHLFTAPFAQPVHELNYSRRAPQLTKNYELRTEDQKLKLWIANIDSVYPWDRGTNYAVELGQKAAKLINS